jgi:hypothetical protein
MQRQTLGTHHADRQDREKQSDREAEAYQAMSYALQRVIQCKPSVGLASFFCG